MSANSTFDRILKKIDESTANFCLDCLKVTSSTDQARMRKYIASKFSDIYLFEQRLCAGCLFRENVLCRREGAPTATTTQAPLPSVPSRQAPAYPPRAWTEEKPATEGWYWHRDPTGRSMIVFVRLAANTVYGYAPGTPLSFPLTGLSGEWFGPLEPPP